MRQKTGRLVGTGLLFLLVVLLCAGMVSVADGTADPVIETAIDPAEVTAGQTAVYLDLALGDVTIGADSYSGKVYGANSILWLTDVKRTGNEKFYIFQSDPDAPADSPAYTNNTGYATWDEFAAKKNCRVPVYPRVYKDGESWTEYITNNTEVKTVSRDWTGAAGNAGRKATESHITFRAESNYTADVTIDNIWTTYHKPGGSATDHSYRTTGGIGADLYANENTHIKLSLKGDNRVGCVHYSAGVNLKNTIEFFACDKDDDTSGSITVADFPEQWGDNFYSAAIGASDSAHGGDGKADMSDGIIIHSGVIWAGTTSKDDCTAIGGGGNNFGGVTIEGGIVTAVTASTGTAIGGGIGWSNPAGAAEVLISGGKVYAYNHGIGPDSGSYVSFVPAAAIGSGSSSTNDAKVDASVTITGGFVYAQSVAGTAIGGGSSGTLNGGNATINISGGTIIAKSIGKEVTYNKGGTTTTELAKAGASIGGGTGGTTGIKNGNEVGANGGSVTLNISGKPIIRTGSIGGGSVINSNYKIGSATVNISGGDIIGQVIMAGGAETPCTFNMSGGRIHGTNVVRGITLSEYDIEDPQPNVRFEYVQPDGGAVWIQNPGGVATITGDACIDNCYARNGGAIYMEGGVVNINTNRGSGSSMDIGGSIGFNTAEENGGGLYVEGGDVTIVDGVVSANTAGHDGGGIFLKAVDAEKKIKAVMLSGSLDNNKAGGKGGAMAVDGNITAADQTQEIIAVEIGCQLDHQLQKIGTDPETQLDKYKPRLPIDYEEEYADYKTFYTGSKPGDAKENKHVSCPDVRSNSSVDAGGAFYLNSPSAALRFFCMTESNNKSGGDLPAIAVNGGRVIIGDKDYHNYQYHFQHPDQGKEVPRGYVSVAGTVLVKGGEVDIYGKLTNPDIPVENISAYIQDSESNYLMDHRFDEDMQIYWLQYNENFTGGTGLKYNRTFPIGTPILVEGAPPLTEGESREGYIFRGWCTKKEYDEYVDPESEDGAKLYKKDDEIDPDVFNQVYDESAALSLHCPDCQKYAKGWLIPLYGIWDKIYTLAKDGTVLEALNAAWEIKYTAVDAVEQEVEKEDGSTETQPPPLTLLEDAGPVEVKPRGAVTFKSRGGTPLPITLTFEADDGEKTVASLEQLLDLNNAAGSAPPKIGVPSFYIPVTKEGDTYTLTMPARHVTVGTEWGLYLDYGTIELYPDGFRQPGYWYGPNKVKWSGVYRIWQCEDDNKGTLPAEAIPTGEGNKVFHETVNMLKLYGDLTGREIVLGRLNISSPDSIQLIGNAQATLTPDQGGKLRVKNILVPTGAALTLAGPGSASYPITLTPDSGDAGIGSHGTITVKNSMITMDSDDSTGYVVNGDTVTLEDSSVGTSEEPVKGQIHAATKLQITRSQIYQQ